MGESTSIEWTDATVNPMRARNLETGRLGHWCEKVSTECKLCYSSERWQRRMGTFPFRAENREKVELLFDGAQLQKVLRRRKPTKWFWGDMTDMFYREYPDEWIDRCFAVMALTPHHTHQVLTKRADRLARYWSPWGKRVGAIYAAAQQIEMPRGRFKPENPSPWRNIWLGVSAGDQQAANERIPHLLATPAAVRFVSYEPALGPVDFKPWLHGSEEHGIDHTRPAGSRVGCCVGYTPPLDWIIAGDESGHGARPSDLAWYRSIRDQCAAAKVAYFQKQLTERGRKIPFEQWPADLQIREFPT